MLRLLIAFVIAYIGFMLILVYKQRSFMYYPLTSARPDISNAPWMSWVEVKTQDGLELKSWYSAPEEGKPTIIFFHGNANSIEARGFKAVPLVRAGYGLLLAEYRGYGGNPGSPTEEGLYMDARAQIDWLIAKHDIKSQNLILYGESLGSAVAVQMAMEYDAAGLILDVPFSSALDLAKANFFYIPFLDYLMKDKYLSDQKIGSVHIPVLIGVGERDSVVPVRFGKKLYAAANEPKTLKVYENANHMGIYDEGFVNAIVAFVEELE